jgi:queuine tRNA-ribosyltransferase
MFDCVLPTRNGRNSYAFTHNGPVRLRNSSHISDEAPVEQDCPCYCCRNFTRAALRHFFKTGEMLGAILLSIHNISFYNRLMADIRQKISLHQFDDWADNILKKYDCFKKEAN